MKPDEDPNFYTALTSTVIVIPSSYAFSWLLPQQQTPFLILLNLSMKLQMVTPLFTLLSKILFENYLIVNRCQLEGKKM